ncbi:hypothetical protein N9Y42_02790 [Mariniblastus sp.]|nr:hypothetical protein [Mariniblastus sp.]
MNNTQDHKKRNGLRSFSIRSLLVVMLLLSVGVTLVSQRSVAIQKERKLVERLAEAGVEIQSVDQEPNWFERFTGLNLRYSHYRVKLNSHQNDFLFELGKLEFVDGLYYDAADYSTQSLIAFDGLKNLKDLDVGPFYDFKSFKGIQDLTKIESLSVSGVEIPQEVKLDALKNHPSLKEVLLDNHYLDPAHDFQQLTGEW